MLCAWLAAQSMSEAKSPVQLSATSRDALGNMRFSENLAHVYVMLKTCDAALDQIEYLLSVPWEISVPLLRIDPRWDHLRSTPRFKKLLRKYS